ncbi:DUF1802 family protein [Cohnella sp. JJ-181]|uniref:DUF1802 family protein n=1 Tax=Cohnella rhizoplanae TaxID=2974897 RepID=UPI0022FF87AD|nr:DUF1802 family protein [Cohnella sp. JJ-181]CAI6082141.1 hypothetical protein COHCIP112018_03543 [Cohnella sp. JJ-181]
MEQPIALREWAVAVKALEAGKQIMVLRKGGIAEETREFRLESPSFFLFPSYEHQREQLVKPGADPSVAETIAAFNASPDTITISSYADVVADIEVTDSETLQKLEPYHLWTEQYAEERLKWKKTKPLHVLLLRVYLLDRPVALPNGDQYGGCKSWLRLASEVSRADARPVLGDEAFQEQLQAVKHALDRRGAGAGQPH